MTPERFAHLADAYGASLHRWPLAEQAPAQALLDSGDPSARLTLHEAAWLDTQLDAHTVLQTDLALARQIRQSVPRRASFWSRYANWLSPAGLVGVGIAGIAAGVLVASMSVPLPMLSSEVLPSVFDQGDAEVVFSVNAEETEQ
jgi:tetrahydromethanopterin S-methyltransferase subunit F